MGPLLGTDEGTSAVRAVRFDADLRPLKEARRDKALAHPRPGWVAQDPEEVLATVVDAVAALLADRPEVAACGLDHQGASVLARDAESGRPLTPIITWQDKRPQAVLDRLESEGLGEDIRERSRMTLDPYFSAGKLTWLLEHDDGVGGALDAGTRRLGTTRSCATGFSTASRTELGAPEWDPALLDISACPLRRCRRSWTRRATSALCGTTPGPSSCPCGRALSTSRRRLPEPAARSRGG